MAKTGRKSSRSSSPTKKVGWSKKAKVAAALVALATGAAMYKGSSPDNLLQEQFDKLYRGLHNNPTNGVIAKTYLWLADHSYNWTTGNPLKYGRLLETAKTTLEKLNAKSSEGGSRRRRTRRR